MHDDEQSYKIPALISNGPHFILCNNGPYALRDVCGVPECEVQLKLVANSVVQVDETPSDLESVLKGIMSRTQGPNGVQGGDSTPPSREIEVVRIAV